MKNKIIKIVIMFLVATMIGSSFAPITSYAANKTVAKDAASKSKTTVTKTTEVDEKSKVKETTSNTISKQVKATNVEKESLVKESKETAVSRILKSIPTAIESRTLDKTYETIIDNVSKEVKKVIIPTDKLEGIETNLESEILKNFSQVDKIEVGSTVVYTLYLKNTSNVEKTLNIKANMPKEILGSRTFATICSVDRNVEDSEASLGLIEEKRVSYKGVIEIALAPKEEKAIVIEQEITNFSKNSLTNTFTLVCENYSMELKDEKNATSPARINAEIELYVNNEKIKSDKPVELGLKDTVKYILNIENTGDTAAELNITENLPREFQITKVEYLNSADKVLLAEEYETNKLTLSNVILAAKENKKIALTVVPKVNGEVTLDNHIEINGNDIDALSTNTLTNTYTINGILDTIQAKEVFEKDLPTRGQSEDILAHFGDVSFLGYGLGNLGKKITIKFKTQFLPSKNMYCVAEGKSYYQYLKMENFYASYNSKMYKYNKSTKKLEEYSGAIGIGNDQNFINEHYNELAYMLSVIDDYNSTEFYQSLGINFTFNGERPDHRLSPVQIAIWRLQGVSQSTMVTKMNNRLKELGVTSSSKRNEIINKILSYATTIYANAKAYDKYVKGNEIGSIPNIQFYNYDPIHVNGKTLVGPFKITYNLETATASYTDVVTGNTKTKTGRYGNIKEVKLTNNGNTYTKIYDADGNEINLSSVKSNQLDCYFNITGKDFDLSKETKISARMNNQYRQAYFFTIASQYSNGQNIIVGRGTRSFKTYSQTFTVEKMNLSGIVWLDLQHGIKSGSKDITPPNGIIDEDEEGVEGIDVYLLDNSKHQIVATTKTNAEGRYAFNNILKSNYSVLFAYEGMNYIVSEAADGETDITKTKVQEKADGVNLRNKFTNRFTTIIKDKVIYKHFIIRDNGTIAEENDNYTIQYNTNNNTSTFITMSNNEIIPVYKMYAKTTSTYNKTQDNINMGLKQRAGDLSLRLKLKELETSKHQGMKANDSYITYAVQLNNQETDVSFVNEILYYYNKNLELVNAECSYYRNGNQVVIPITNIQTNSNITIEGKTLKSLSAGLPMSAYVQEGERTTVLLKFKIKDGTMLTDDFTAYSEISSYTINGGIIDKDSRPGNGIESNGTTLLEDDFDYVDLSNLRTYMMQISLPGLFINP